MPGEAQALRRRHGLAVDAEPAPAHQGGGQHKAPPSGGESRYAGDHLQRPHRPGRHPGRQQSRRGPKDHHKGADLEHGGGGLCDGGGRRPGQGERGCRAAVSQQGPPPVPAEPAEDHPGEKGGEHMDAIEPGPRPGIPQGGGHKPQEEGGTAVVAEAQQQLRLLFLQVALLVKPRRGLGSGGISPQQSRQQRQSRRAGHAEQRPHQRGEGRLQISGQPQLEQKGHRRHKGEQGGDHHLGAQAQPVLDRQSGG